MIDDTCVVDGCGNRAKCRGLCNPCYHRARRLGILDDVALPGQGQAVTNVDVEAMTCDCPKCGPGVRLRIRSGRRGKYGCRKCNRGERRPETADGRRLRKYGVTAEEFQIRLTAQGGRCLICGDKMEVPCVDHCHEFGHVRGILCSRCNIGLGCFQDRPELLRKAARYVTKYKAPLH